MPPQYTIRPMTIADASAVREVMAHSWLASYPSPENGVSREWVESRIEKWSTPEWTERWNDMIKIGISDECQFYRVGIQGERVVGLIMLAATLDDSTVELKAIHTEPETFGTGLGTLLFESTDDWIANRPVVLEVGSYNARAIRFYEKHGFRIVKGTESLYADTIPIVQMRKATNNQNSRAKGGNLI